ncbi:MAG: pantoate--beta-alanine ligase [Clostridiales Family XIII bacterium]|jgi:pantoate--beta-alanine ligase|nr:pantoate--beta-alanine ligase [Clostridiales Family XIII bacterium]
MEIIRTVSEMKAAAAAFRAEGLSAGLVPTMGSLHEGHMSLVRKAVSENDRTVVSIFVNPIQFEAHEDFGSYPRDMAKDSELCERASVDVVFNPSAREMYPDGFHSYVDMSVLTEGLCGARRPNHFRGVCTVVSKLFNITYPRRAYFGQKDAQQLAVIKRMVLDLNMDVEVVGMPVIREADGLAMSSRNAYLNDEERADAAYICKALSEASRLFDEGERDIRRIERHIGELLSKIPSIALEYAEIVDAKTMRPPDGDHGEIICAVAARVGKTRLIDNVRLK